MAKQNEKKQMSGLKVLIRLLHSFKKRNRSYAYFLMFFYTIAAGALPVVLIYIPRTVIDYLTEGGSESVILKAVAVIVGISLILGVISAVTDFIYKGVATKVRISEWDDMARMIVKLDYKYMEDSNFSDRMGIATECLNGNDSGFENGLSKIFATLPLIVSSVLYSVIIGKFQPVIFIACFFGTAVTVCVNKAVANYTLKRKEDKAKAERHVNYYNNTCYDFSYGKDVRVYNLTGKLADNYKKEAVTYIKVIKDIANRKFFYGLYELFTLLLSDGIAYFFIVKGYYYNLITLGDVSLYIGAVIALSTALRTVSQNFGEITASIGYCRTYFEFLSDKTLFAHKGGNTALPSDETLKIEFKNVSFKYPGTENYVIKNFDFTIEKGEKLAIVGINGAGKSTIIKLITGLFDVTEGEILINGTNIGEFDSVEYRKMFSVVFQDINIFSGTVIENVTGKNPTEEQREFAIECLEKVGLKEKIESLPKKYDTTLLKVIEDDGVELSGGQNQKIAIARALYKNANAVILDEPTSALDALAEAEIYRSFDDLTKGKTAIYISHRLSSTKFCDKIALFSKDGLAEYGNHSDLMAEKGKYYEMFETQGKYYREGATNEKN